MSQVGRLTGQNLLPLSLGGDRMVGKRVDLQLGNRVTGVGYGDAGGGIVHIAELPIVVTA